MPSVHRLTFPARTNRRSPRRRGVIGACLATLAVAVLLGFGVTQPALGASPAPSSQGQGSPALPSPSPIIGTGDPRTNGGGPGLVGSPFVIALAVLALGALAAGGTVVYLRVRRQD